MNWALLLAGLLIKQQAQREYEKRMLTANRARAQRRESINEENQNKILEELKQFDPQTRKQKRVQAEQKTENQLSTELMDVVRQNMGEGKVTEQRDPAAIESALRTREAANKASALAALLSRYRAPTDVARDEKQRSRDLMYGRRAIRNKGRGMDIVDVNYLNAIRPDPMKELIGSGLMAYGTAKAMSTPSTPDPMADFYLKGLQGMSTL